MARRVVVRSPRSDGAALFAAHVSNLESLNAYVNWQRRPVPAERTGLEGRGVHRASLACCERGRSIADG